MNLLKIDCKEESKLLEMNKISKKVFTFPNQFQKLPDNQENFFPEFHSYVANQYDSIFSTTMHSDSKLNETNPLQSSTKPNQCNIGKLEESQTRKKSYSPFKQQNKSNRASDDIVKLSMIWRSAINNKKNPNNCIDLLKYDGMILNLSNQISVKKTKDNKPNFFEKLDCIIGTDNSKYLYEINECIDDDSVTEKKYKSMERNTDEENKPPLHDYLIRNLVKKICNETDNEKSKTGHSKRKYLTDLSESTLETNENWKSKAIDFKANNKETRCHSAKNLNKIEEYICIPRDSSHESKYCHSKISYNGEKNKLLTNEYILKKSSIKKKFAEIPYKNFQNKVDDPSKPNNLRLNQRLKLDEQRRNVLKAHLLCLESVKSENKNSLKELEDQMRSLECHLKQLKSDEEDFKKKILQIEVEIKKQAEIKKTYAQDFKTFVIEKEKARQELIAKQELIYRDRIRTESVLQNKYEKFINLKQNKAYEIKENTLYKVNGKANVILK